MTSRKEFDQLCTVLPDQRKHIFNTIDQLLDSDDSSRDGLLDVLLGYIQSEEASGVYEQALSEYSALFMHRLITLLSGGKSSHRSHLYDFLILLNHIPIKSPSNWSKALDAALDCEKGDYAHAFVHFDKLQLVYLLCRIGDYQTAEKIFQDINAGIPSTCPRLYSIYALTQAKLLLHAHKHEDFIRFWLQVIVHYYQTDGAETALYFLIRWLEMTSRHLDGQLKRSLLLDLAHALAHHHDLLSAIVLYETFHLEDKLINPTDKMQYARRLIKHPVSLLTVQQLQTLYFFAGNYSSGMQSKFKESIQYFQYSNYFLHKCWDYHRNVSLFLRNHLHHAEYVHAMPYLEASVNDLGSQVSIQNNAYVETLQAIYDKIDDLYNKVEELSITDTLTGLRNRRYLENNIYQMLLLAARHKVPICFAIADIDHFKLVNDNYGHPAGDYVLKELAQLLSNSFRKSDVIVRYGGEEFLIVLFDAGLERSMQLLEEFRIEVQNHPFQYRGQAIPITISIGVTDGEYECRHDNDIAAKIAAADAALYKAKNSGRNQVVHH